MSTNCGTKIKICGMFRECDIDYVNQYKPDYIGFIFWDRSHRYVDFDTAAALRTRLDKDIKAVGVFVDADIDAVINAANSDIIDLIQLHGSEDESYVRAVRAKTGKPVIKAVKIVTGEEIARWNESEADYLLLDSGMGTGKTFDWNKASVRPDKPFFLAGGIGADNICEAEALFKPYAVDLSSSVETDRVKDPVKIEAVISAIRKRQG